MSLASASVQSLVFITDFRAIMELAKRKQKIRKLRMANSIIKPPSMPVRVEVFCCLAKFTFLHYSSLVIQFYIAATCELSCS
jgi:hypothetical protein